MTREVVYSYVIYCLFADCP